MRTKKPVSDAAKARHCRIYERFLVQRAVGDKWTNTFGEQCLGAQILGQSQTNSHTFSHSSDSKQ